ncbi:MAG: glycoside hydrolase family 25 protein [Acetatifactor sp.]|nr:glycoside hydrolase family 25 protein [Acetatifactor sp.]MDE7351498.1 glycoside hydrolase family 25 protein [Acetatifactor sp.]
MDNEQNMDREEKLRAAARKNRRRRSVFGTFLAMLGCLVVMVGIMYGGVTLYSRLADQEGVSSEGGQGQGTNESGSDLDDDTVGAVSEKVVYSQEELDARVAEAVLSAQGQVSAQILEGIKDGLSNGNTVLETLRPLYPDDLIVASGGRYHFVPINRSLKQNQLDIANVNILESGEYQYLVDGQIISHKGIDVSKHQGAIDWNLVAQDGVEFAFIRVGFRGYGSEGKMVEDEYFVKNIEGALAAGIKVGVYFYSQAITEAEAREEAEFVIERIRPYEIACPVVFDVERVSGAQGRMNDISVEERTALAVLFCQTIEQAGYKPMIYHNTEMGALMLDLTQLESYDKWYASYSDQIFYPYAYKIWQYSDKGSVQGINTDVDLNISFEPLWE